MAVMTHAHARLEANYKQLTLHDQDRFDELMEAADIAGPHDYPSLMLAVAALTGLPAGDIRKCGCSCTCPTIFDSNNEDTHVIKHGEGYNLGRHQCAWCADQHRETA
jgi:hypothetical protein